MFNKLYLIQLMDSDIFKKVVKFVFKSRFKKKNKKNTKISIILNLRKFKKTKENKMKKDESSKAKESESGLFWVYFSHLSSF